MPGREDGAVAGARVALGDIAHKPRRAEQALAGRGGRGRAGRATAEGHELARFAASPVRVEHAAHEARLAARHLDGASVPDAPMIPLEPVVGHYARQPAGLAEAAGVRAEPLVPPDGRKD